MPLYVLGYEPDGITEWYWTQQLQGVGWIEQIVRDWSGSLKNQLEDAWLPGAVAFPNDMREVTAETRAGWGFGAGMQSFVRGHGNEYRAEIEGTVEVTLQTPVGRGEADLWEIVTDLTDFYRYKSVGVICESESPHVQYKRVVARGGGTESVYEILFVIPFRSMKMLARVAEPAWQSGQEGQALAETDLRTRFGTLIEDVTGLDVFYDNEGGELPSAAESWIRFQISAPSYDLTELGPGAYRLNGRAVASVMAPLRSGLNASARLCDQILDAMRTVSTNETTLRLPVPIFSGRRGAWWQTQMVCPFFADQVV